MSSYAPLVFPPGVFRLSISRPESLAEYLVQLGVLAGEERIHEVSPPGEGNMNVVLRVRTDQRTLIVKQAVPWVVKYPQFAAPWDRALREMEFYALIARKAELAQRLPRLLASDRTARLLVLEDLGSAADLTPLYQGSPLNPEDAAAVVEFLSALHASFRDVLPGERIANREMRALNSPHLFQIHLQPNSGLNLDAREAGLSALAAPLKADASLRDHLRTLETQHYLTDGPALVHGDLFPGCLLATAGGLRVIDPEFCFFGPPEFDLGIWIGHLLLARQAGPIIERTLEDYRPGPSWSPELVARFAGAEILRRLLGYAQLPLAPGLGYKRQLIARARNLVLGGKAELLVQPLE